jgi:putative transposase
MLPVLAAVLRWRKLLVGPSWRVDEIYVSVGGRWKYLYRAVDKLGQTVDYLLTAHRDVAASRRFLGRAIDLRRAGQHHDRQERRQHGGRARSGCRQRRGHRALPVQIPDQRRRAGPPCHQEANAADDGLQTLWFATKIIAGIETMHMIKKGQLGCPGGLAFSPADYFYSLAAA